MIHRLENGEGAVTVVTLFRYAKALGISPRELFEFRLEPGDGESVIAARQGSTAPKIIELDDPRVARQAFRTLLPVYSLKAAAGAFKQGESVHPAGWVEVKARGELDQKMFVAKAIGHSMLPRIHDGDLLVFRANPSGTRQGKIVLAQYRGPSDPETGGSYTVKEYHSSKAYSPDGKWRHTQITLRPLNPDFEPILLFPESKDDFRIVAEYLFTLREASR